MARKEKAVVWQGHGNEWPRSSSEWLPWLEAALLGRPLPGKKGAPPLGNAWAQMMFDCCRSLMVVERYEQVGDLTFDNEDTPRIFEVIRERFATSPARDALVRAICLTVPLGQDCFARVEDHDGKPWYEPRHRMTELVVYARLLQELGFAGPAFDLLCDAYARMRGLESTFPPAIAAGLRAKNEETVRCRVFAAFGFEGFQSWAEEDLSKPESTAMPAGYRNSYTGWARERLGGANRT
jgi:hypothetical protein